MDLPDIHQLNNPVPVGNALLSIVIYDLPDIQSLDNPDPVGKVLLSITIYGFTGYQTTKQSGSGW